MDSNTCFLNYWVTKKYHNEVILYILQSINQGLLDDDATAPLIRKYFLRVLPLLETWLENEFKIQVTILSIYMITKLLMRNYSRRYLVKDILIESSQFFKTVTY